MVASDERRGSSVRARLGWSFVASAALNIALWSMSYPHVSFTREAQNTKPAVVPIRIEHRPALHRRPHRKPPKPRRVAKPHSARPHPKRKASRPIPKRAVQRAHPKRALPAHRPPAGPMSFTPHQFVAIKLPAGWSTQDQANGAAANTTLWLDFKKARGAFVPRVFLMQLKTTYLSGPTLPDAVHDIVGVLQAGGAQMHASQPQRVCGGKRLGWFLSYGKTHDDPPWQFEEILFMSGDTVYRATYARPDGNAADPKTRAALNTLCPLH